LHEARDDRRVSLQILCVGDDQPNGLIAEVGQIAAMGDDADLAGIRRLEAERRR